MALERPPLSFLAGFAAAAALWLGVFCADIGMASTSSRWMVGLIAWKEAIARRVQGPRIVVTGGSGALYGIRARDLSSALGIPVINGGLHAGLGLEYILHEARRLARPGDTVLLALEYELYVRLEDDTTVDYVVAHDPAYFEQLGLRRQLDWILGMPFHRLANPWLRLLGSEPPPYFIYFNPHGDVLGNHEFFKSQGLRDSITLDRADIRRYRPRAAQLLEAFAEWAREHRVRLLATHPNMIGFESTLRQPNVPRDLEAIDALHRSLGIVFVDRWDETMMDRGLFFDTVYHPDNVGSTIRTRDLARRLRPYIDAREWGPPFLPGPGVSPVELVDRAFYRIEPVSGFDRMAGLDPPEGEVFTRIRGSRAEALVRTLRASGARFTARLRSPERRQDIEVLVNAEPVILWTVGSTDAYEEFAADVHLKAGDNHLALVKSAANAVDVRELRVDLPGDAPAH